jgi:hypothetical protein
MGALPLFLWGAVVSLFAQLFTKSAAAPETGEDDFGMAISRLLAWRAEDRAYAGLLEALTRERGLVLRQAQELHADSIVNVRGVPTFPRSSGSRIPRKFARSNICSAG